MSTPTIRIFEDQQILIENLANLFFKIGNKAIAKNDQFSVVLSGGNSPKVFYTYLTKNKKKIDWTKVFFFFGDERAVPFESEENNATMAEKYLFTPLQIPPTNYFRMDTRLSPNEAANDYEPIITKFFNNQKVQFDFLLLGLGDNAHTASLFPFTEVLQEKLATVKSVFVSELNAYRITFTAALINQAKNAAFLVFGKEKAKAVFEILVGNRNPEKFPAQLIDLNDGNLFWFLDEEAAKLYQNH